MPIGPMSAPLPGTLRAKAPSENGSSTAPYAEGRVALATAVTPSCARIKSVLAGVVASGGGATGMSSAVAVAPKSGSAPRLTLGRYGGTSKPAGAASALPARSELSTRKL